MKSKAILIVICLTGLIVANALALDPHFQPAVNYAVNLTPTQVISADFNHDGKPDLAAVNSLNNSVSILWNNGNGTFSAPVNYPVGIHPVALCAIDVDADGFADLAVANYGAATVTILMNLTNGTFDVPVDYSTGGIQPTSICSADFDGDLKIDLAVANYGSGNAAVMINLNNSKFPTAVTYPTGNNPTSVFAADVNMDGKPDVVVTNATDNNVSILINNGNGIFPAAVNYGTGVTPISVFAADFDGNGSPDLAVANSGANTVSVLKNNGNGTFAASVDYPVGNSPNGVFAADLDNDGKPELALADKLFDSVSVLRNNGNGTFSAALYHAVGTGPAAVCAADFDVDGFLDLATANSSSNDVSILTSVRQHAITATAGANGSVSPLGAVVVYDGGGQTFTIAANNCYHIFDVLVDGVSVGALTSYPFTGVTANHTISAMFAVDVHILTATPGPNGTITPWGPIPIDCGSSRTYSIAANSCYHIADVLVDGVSVGPVTSYSFTGVTADHSLSATFAVDVHTITSTASPKGTISPSGAVPVNCGSDQAFTITPDPGGIWHVKDVKVDGVSVGAVTSHTIANVTADRTIAATFTCCVGKRGNVNCGGIIDLADLSSLVSYLTGGLGLPLCCPDAANVNGVGIIDLSDLSALVSYLTGGSFVLPNCP